MTPLRLILLSLLLAPLLSAAPALTHEFTNDGKPAEPRILPVLGEAKGKITEGDIAFFDGFTFVVGQPGRYELRVQGEQDSELLCRFNGGPEHHLAIRILESYDDDDHRIDALAKLNAEQRKRLRGLTLDVPTKDWATAFKDIDWTTTALSITEDIADEEQEEVLPPLPESLRYLEISINSSPSITDYSSLKALKDLRFFDLRSWGAFDFRLLRNATELRNLSVQSCPVTRSETLSTLSELRFLKLRWTDDLDSIAFAAKMPELRVLKVDDTDVTSLRPLNGLKHLRLLSATESMVATLPDGSTLPALREIRLLSTPASAKPDAIAAFQAAAPECLVKARWGESLRDAIAGASRLRVRSGGTCHRNPATEKTLFEIKKPDMIDALVSSLEIDEERSGFHCMCCGNPSLEFYDGKTLLATLGFHHGRSLRWSKGLWPGDAIISSENADLLCDLMADNGYTGPREQRDHEKASQRAERRYWDAVRAILPEAVLKSVWQLAYPDPDAEEISEEERTTGIQDIITNRWPDEIARAKALFTIYGALPEMSWSLSTGMDEILRDHLLSRSEEQIATLLSNTPDPQVMQGIARWCFFDREGEAAKAKLTPTHLALLSAWGLGHPRDVNRRKTLIALDSRSGEPLLLAFLRKPAARRPLAKELEVEPGGSTTYTPDSLNLADEASDRVAAAHLLARRASEAARPTLEKLAASGPKAERPAYAAALTNLNTHTK